MGQRTIVWVEDQPEVFHVLMIPLERDGYKVVPMKSLREVLNRIEELRAATLLILDLIFPDGALNSSFPGLDLLRRLRNEYGVQTPVLLLSIVDHNTIADDLSELNVAFTLRKPVSPFDLKQYVRECLALPAPGDERAL